MRRAAVRVLVVAGLMSSLVACGQPYEDAVLDTAAAFYRAHAAGDGQAACDLLAPRTRSELEKSAGKPCAEAVLAEQLPQVNQSEALHVFGTQAEVGWDGETTFLSRFQDGWKVMAAGCTPRTGHPHDCTISGG